MQAGRGAVWTMALAAWACGAAPRGGDEDVRMPDGGGATADAPAFVVGDASRPDPPCGVPVRHFVVDSSTHEVAGRGAVLLLARIERAEIDRGTLHLETVSVDDGLRLNSSGMELPVGGWNVWATGFAPSPVALLGAVSRTVGEPPAILWAESYTGGRGEAIDLVELDVPSRVSFDEPSGGAFGPFAAGPDGFLRLVTVDGEPRLARLSRSGIELLPVSLPPGSSRYVAGASAVTGEAYLVAFGLEGMPGVAVARVGDGGVPSGSFRRIADVEASSVALSVSAAQVVVTVVRDAEVDVAWLDGGLAERRRTAVPLDSIEWGTAIGSDPGALVASRRREGRTDRSVLFGLLAPPDGVFSSRSFVDTTEPSVPVVWQVEDGRFVVALPGPPLDVFVLCRRP